MTTDSRDIITVAPRGVSDLMPAMRLVEAKERRDQMVAFVREIMIDGTDFGVVPGTGSKPTLLKPGAEKLKTFFGLSNVFEVIEKVEDWTGDQHGGEPLFYYWYRCKLYRGDQIIGEGEGSCNSWETKYRYRKAERVCPQCGQATIIKGRAEYGGGWLCYAKRGGCGAKFTDGDTRIAGQVVGHVRNPDPADVVNTIKKMAQKRALVGAVLISVNASEFFTQDMEDFAEGTELRNQSAGPPPNERHAAETETKRSAAPKGREPVPDARPVLADTTIGEIVEPAGPGVPTAPELAKQAVARGVWDKDGARAWCEARGVKRIDDAPEKDRVALAHELANRIAARQQLA